MTSGNESIQPFGCEMESKMTAQKNEHQSAEMDNSVLSLDQRQWLDRIMQNMTKMTMDEAYRQEVSKSGS